MYYVYTSLDNNIGNILSIEKLKSFLTTI